MLWFFMLVLIIIPAIEITIFILLGNSIGVLSIFLLIISTGIIGYFFMKQQGMETWRKLRLSLANGERPGDELLSMFCIIIGGIMLVLPGFLTDIIGFLLVFPWTRGPFKALMLFIMMKKLASKGTIVYKRR